ncbi:MAG TPA: glycosyltransferase family 39 protein [candidate division Zixibacteria bacterium]|nr:glycosyltransferase family 39 protein [candidate division Zixibacteria bacterium]
MSSPQNGFQKATLPWWRRHPGVAVAAVAFALRLIVIFGLQTYHFPKLETTEFAFGYETGSIAGSIARGQGFSSPFGVPTGPTAWIAPIYPYMLAGIFKLLGTYTLASAAAILVLNSAFAALSCAALYELGTELLGRTVGLLASWAFAVVPFFMRWPTTWAWDPPLSALLLTCLLLVAVRLRGVALPQWFAFGLLWGVTALVNPALLSLMPLCLVYSAWRLRWRGVLPACLAFFAMLITISPWLVRNRSAMGQWVFLRDNFGLEFSMGNFPNSPGVPFNGRHPRGNARLMQQYKELGEVQFCRARLECTKAWVKANPGDFARLTLKRAADFWDGEELRFEPRNEPWSPWMIALTSAIAWAGMIALIWCQERARFLLLGLLLIYPLPYYITYTNPRYRHAIEPEMVLMSAYLVWIAWERVRDLPSLEWLFVELGGRTRKVLR